MEPFLKKQIITYMGNKRKILPHIELIIKKVQEQLGKEKLNIADGFSGSGIVSRLFKKYASNLHTNDIAGYAKTLNQCYLATPNKKMLEKIHNYIDHANQLMDLTQETGTNVQKKFIQLHWAPKDDVIKEGERAYYTKENARRIDYYHQIIDQLPKEIRPFLLAPLLVEASIHTNTNGQFSAFYKKDKVGHYGGKNEIDVKRITQNIVLPRPIFSLDKCKTTVSQADTNDWIKEIPEMDLVYYDPPYNKHPYNIYYFLLDIINDYNTDIEIPDSLRGQPKNWKQSDYNSQPKAKETFELLIKNTKSKYILVSYNNGGIIPLDEMSEILKKYGVLEEINIDHGTYNRMRGIAEYKKHKDTKTEKIKECLYFLKTQKIKN